MAPSVLLPLTDLAVMPGESVSTELRVHNTGAVVDEFAIQPLGVAADWITVEPALVRLFPDTDTTVTVTITPPRASSTTPGPTAWAVKTTPRDHPEHAAVAEGTVVVGVFNDLAAELQPAAGRGRLRGRFEVAVDNRGNVSRPVRVAGTDAEQRLDFAVAPATFDAAPGTATFPRIKVRPARRIWHGKSTSHPFQLLVSSQPAPLDDVSQDEPTIVPVVLSGTFVQEPVLPKWLLKAVLIAGILLLALFILWKTLIKPTFESAARAVVAEEVEDVDADVAALGEEVAAQAAQTEQATQAAEEASSAAKAADEVASGAAAAVADEGGSAFDAGDPTSFRVTASAAPGAASAGTGPVVGAGESFLLTDIMLQNPGADQGLLRILVNGETIYETALESFAFLDVHQVSPFVVAEGQAASIELDCSANQEFAGDPCDVAVTFAGFSTPEEG